LQTPGSLARAVTVDSESATKPARCIPSPLWGIKKIIPTMIKQLIILGFVTLISCSSRTNQPVNQVVVKDSLSSKMETETEKLFDFYYKFASDKSYQLERIEFPLKIQNYGKSSSINKADWEHDYLFVNLEYITHIFNSFTKTFDYNADFGDNAIFSWIYPDKQEKKDYYFQVINGKWYLNKIVMDKMDFGNTESFIPFLKQFMSDSVFQMSRIKFPLEYKTFYDSDEENFLDTTLILNQSDWRFNSLFNGLKQLTNFSYSWSSEFKDTDDMLLFVSGVENGIFIQYFFKRIDEKWYLIKKNDEST